MAKETLIGKYHVQVDSERRTLVRRGSGRFQARSSGARVPRTGMPAKHTPFASAGTPRQAERIRFFDVKHIKAELVVDTKNHKISGVVTHTISPLHPFLTQIELDCGPELVVTKVTAGASAAPCKFETKQGKLSIKLDKAYGTNETIDVAVSYSGLAVARALFCRPGRPLSQEDAFVLDPGRVRGHAVLASMLRLSE